MLHRVVGKTGCPDPVVDVEGGRWEVATVPLAEVGCHEQDVPAKLDKLGVTTPQPHLLLSEISNKEISLCVVECD